MSTYVLVHGAWHDGELLEPTAAAIRAMGHVVHTPTLAGNRKGDSKKTGLAEAIRSLVDYFDARNLSDVVLVGHSWGGMVITGAADSLAAGRIRRLVYWNAFVPNDGECLNDMIPAMYVALFDSVSQPDGSVMLPFPVWREAFTNDMSMEESQAAFDRLNAHPYATFTDKIRLSKPPAAMEIAKSYLNFTGDAALPHSLPWHPRLSEKLGLFRLVLGEGSHEVCFSNPNRLGEKIVEAGRD